MTDLISSSGQGLRPIATIFTALPLLLVAIILYVRLSSRASTQHAPVSVQRWRSFGALGFLTSRAEFLDHGKMLTSHGQFSFWYGMQHCVAVSGHEARNSFLTSRGLDAASGFIALAGNFLNIQDLTRSYARRLFLVYKRCGQDHHLEANLHHLVTDSASHLRNIKSSEAMDPIDFMGKLAYQLSHRITGAHDVADDPALLHKTYAMVETLEEDSFLDAWFPLLPTPRKISKIWAFTRLHRCLKHFVAHRRRKGERGADGMQILMDQDCTDALISLSIVGSLMAGLFNIRLNIAWTLCFLAHHRDVLRNVRLQIDDLIAHGRHHPGEDTWTVLQRLELRQWESQFPLLDAALRETLRFTMSGPMIRQNIGGTDVQIGNTGMVIPKQSLVVYSSSDTHMNESIYRHAQQWNPYRWTSTCDQKNEATHTFLAWGSGHHICRMCCNPVE